MRKKWVVFFANICLVLLIGCNEEKLYPKSVEIEVGSDASIDVLDYVDVSDYNENIKDMAKLDLSNVDVMRVGKYVAKVIYGGREITIPVSVVDTTSPIIKVKDRIFYEGDQVIADDLAEVVDASDVALSLLSDSKGMELKFETLQPDISVVLKAVDQYGNETIKEVTLDVLPKENQDYLQISDNRSYNRLDDFPYDDMQYIGDEAYEKIKEIYDNVEWHCDLKLEDIKQNRFYLKRYKKLLDGEETFLKTDQYTYSEVNEYMYLSQFLEIEENYVPEESFDGGLGHYSLYFFDFDLDDVPELCIKGRLGVDIFKYRADTDEIILWKSIYGSGVRILGSRMIGEAWEAQKFTYQTLNQNGEMDVFIYFIRNASHGEENMTYLISLPQYQMKEQQIEVSDSIMKQGYYDKSQNLIFFCVTEEQFQELFQDFWNSYYKKSEENMEKAFYSYKKLFE